MPEKTSQKPLTFEIERDGETAVVKCHGRLVWGQTEALYGDVKLLLPQTKELVLDLADLTFVDSSGLGVLVRMYVAARSAGCQLSLLHLGQQLRNLLTMTNLTNVLHEAGSHNTHIA